jgi:hypothetical protein
VDGDLAGDQKYLRAALTNQYNVILTLGAVAFAVAFASWLPVLVGLVGEAGWLFIGPRLAAFRRHTDALIARADDAKVALGLPPDYAQRVASVETDARHIGSLSATRVDLTAEQKHEVARRLRPAVQTFVSVCATAQRLRRVIQQAPVNELMAEISSLQQSLATETDLGIRASLRRALSVAERRTKQLEANESAARALELALSTLQRSLSILKEGAAGLSTGPEICAELDVATSQLSRAAVLEAEREMDLGGTRMSTLPPALN